MCEHLERRGTRYAIRRKIPADLVAYYGRTIYTKALGTSDYSEAKRLCRLLAVALDAEWFKVRASQRGEEPPVEAPVVIQPVLLPKLAGCSLRPRRAAIKRSEPKGTTMLAVARKWALERKPAARTVSRTYNIVEEFRRHTGCSIIEQATREHVLKFKDALLEAGQTPGNINVKIPMLGVVFNYACDNAIIKANPSARVRVADKRKANEKRLPFEECHLQAIFSGSVYSSGYRPKAGGGEAAYWIPLLALFTGGRLNELGQLRPEDVYEESYTDGQGRNCKAWVVRITADDDCMEVKTESSIRRIPVHSKLLELGFVEFVVKQRGHESIFHEIKRDQEGKITNTWGKWFINQYMRGVCGVSTDKRLVFHSFRHTFKHLARLAGIPKEINDAITGHTSGDVADNYGGLSYPLAPLIEGMKHYKIPEPVFLASAAANLMIQS